VSALFAVMVNAKDITFCCLSRHCLLFQQTIPYRQQAWLSGRQLGGCRQVGPSTAVLIAEPCRCRHRREILQGQRETR